MREKEKIRPKRASRGAKMGSSEKAIGGLRAIKAEWTPKNYQENKTRF